jgi:hypothetical protein
LKIRDDVCKIDEKPHRHTRQVERNRRGACPCVSSLLPPAGSGNAAFADLLQTVKLQLHIVIEVEAARAFADRELGFEKAQVRVEFFEFAVSERDDLREKRIEAAESFQPVAKFFPAVFEQPWGMPSEAISASVHAAIPLCV